MNKLTLQNRNENIHVKRNAKGNESKKAEKRKGKTLVLTNNWLVPAARTNPWKRYQNLLKLSLSNTASTKTKKTSHARKTWTLPNNCYVNETKCPFGVFNYSSVKFEKSESKSTEVNSIAVDKVLYKSALHG